MEKNLGHATAYGYAKSKGYSGTEEEFAELMADYATVGQSAAQSAEQAAASATSASGSAATASEAAQTATGKASEAVTAAGTSTTKASEASTSADTASAAATSASTSAQTATTAAATATAKASEASESAATATTAKTDAETARDAAAQSASEAAESARTLIIDAVPTQGSNNAVRSGGVYEALHDTDTTLSQRGQAADAFETGNKITSLKEDLSIIKKSVKYPYTDGKFIGANGKLATGVQYAYTEFVPCDYNTEIYLIDIRVGPSALAYAFYSEKDENRFISGQNNLIGDVYNITIPSNAKYVRFSSRTTDGGSNTWSPQAYVYNSLAITKKVETVQNDVSEIETDVSELQSSVSNISEKISAITPEDTTFFDIYDFIKSSFVKYVSGFTSVDGKFFARDNFELTSIEIKVEPNTTYVLEIPGANRNAGTSNDTGIFEEGTAYNTLAITKVGNYLTFTTGSDVSYAVIYFYNGTYDMSHGIDGIHLYKDSVKSNMAPTVKLENLPDSIKDNIEPLNILIFGDSISDTINFTIDSETDTTTAYSVKVPNNSYTNGQGQIIQYEMWPTLIQRVLNVAELRNYAKAGAHFYTTSSTPADPRQKLLYQVEVAFNDLTNPNGVFPSNDFEPDIIIIACGINDGNIASGSFGTTMAKTVMNQSGTGVDVEATMIAMNQQSTMDAMRYVLMKIKQRFPTALLLYINPLQQTYSTNEARLTAREELRKMAEQYGFINLDGFGEFGVVRDFETQNEIGLLTKDGLHPNDKGQNLYARNIVQAIKRYYFPLDSFNP